MREIRTSGLKRAEEAASLPLRYSTSSSGRSVHLAEDHLEELFDPLGGLSRGDCPDARREEAPGGLIREASPVPVPGVDDQTPGL
jgi:hypothetical protein